MDYADPPTLGTITERNNLDAGALNRRLEGRSSCGMFNRNHKLGLDATVPFQQEKIKAIFSAGITKNDGNSVIRSTSSNYDEFGQLTGEQTSSSVSRSSSPVLFNGGVSLEHHWGRNNREGYDIAYTYADSRNDMHQDMLAGSMTGGQPGQSRSDAATSSTRQAITLRSRFLPGEQKRSGWLYFDLGYYNRLYENASQYWFYDAPTGDYVLQEARSNGLNYRQQVFNGKISYMRSYADKFSWSVQLGADRTANKGTYLGAQTTGLDYDEFNFMPSASVSRLIKKWRLNLRYDTRVMRPDVSLLNPYVNYADPKNIISGNPKLKGEYAHRLNGALYRQFESRAMGQAQLRYGIEWINNAIAQVTTVDAQNTSLTTYANLGRNMRQEASLGWSSGLPFPQWTTTNLVIGYTRGDYTFPSGQTNTVRGLKGSFVMAGTIGRKGPSFYAQYEFFPASVSVQQRGSNYYSSLNMWLQYDFSKIRLGGEIGMTDLLHSHKFVKETTGSERFIQNAWRERMGRTFVLSLYWRFGRFRESDRPKGVQTEQYDMSRPEMLN